MEIENRILCVSNAYSEKYYYNPLYSGIPSAIQEELKILCVSFTADVGGILTFEFEENGEICILTASNEGDLLYDEIGSGLKTRQIQRTKSELLEALTLYYKAFILKQNVSQYLCE